jgi:ribosome-associated toxin RatA of RatAB toxin-antitoxin module
VKSSISIDVAAPPELVFALARDVERWADLLPHYLRARRIRAEAGGSMVVQFVARRAFGPLGLFAWPVAWRARTWSEPDVLQLRFVHLGGATGGMDVTWRIEHMARGGTHVTIEHAFAAPVAWAAFIERAFTRPIASRTLASFRAIAEAANESAAAPPTNHSP